MNETCSSGFQTIGMGVCFLIVGIVMMKTGNPSMIHSYHIALVPRNRWPFIARLTGLGGAVTGAGAIFAGACLFVTDDETSPVFVLAVAIMLIGVGIMLATITVFTFRPWS